VSDRANQPGTSSRKASGGVADVPRRVSADPAAGFAMAVAPAGTRAYTLDGTRVAPGCAVPDGDKLVPAWVA
jgi:hypothetical protein